MKTFLRLVLVTSLMTGVALALPGCGTKDRLLMPNGDPTPKNQKDPSQPPSPIQR